MASVFFPEPMTYLEMVCPAGSAYFMMKNLAEVAAVELIDANKKNVSFQKRYADSFMQCEEAERLLRFIEHKLKDVKADEQGPLMPPTPHLEESIAGREPLNLLDVLEQLREVDQRLHEQESIFDRLRTELFQETRKL
jgi:hypothetical protein